MTPRIRPFRPPGLLIATAGLFAVCASPAIAGWPPCGVSVAPSSAVQDGPAIAIDPTIGVFVAWNEAREDPLTFKSYVQRLSPDGELATGWPSGGLALPGPADPAWWWASRDNLTSLADGRGGVFIVDGCYGSQGHAQLHRVTSEGPAPEWPAGGVTVSAFPSAELSGARDPDIESPQGTGPGDLLPVLALDGTGGVLVAWMYATRVVEYLHVQRITSTGEISPGWPALGRRIGMSGSLPAICTDGAGGALVASTSYEYECHVLVHHLLGDGTYDPSWLPEGRRVSSFPGRQTSPALAPDGSGGCYVVWQDPRNGTFSRTFLQRIRADGSIAEGWPADGMPLSSFLTEAGGRYSHSHGGYRGPRSAIIADGTGGVIVAWRDYRSHATQADLYAQRVLGTGAIAAGWPENGLPVCVAGGDQTALRAASDGDQGAYFVWEDWRGADADVYAQHIRSSAAVAEGWPADGFLVCGAPGNQMSPYGAVDAEGLVAAWVDAGGARSRIVAARVAPDAVVSTSISRVWAEVAANRATIRWELSGDAKSGVLVYRRTEGTAWALQTSTSADARARITHDDRTVEPGTRYGYRLGIVERDGEHHSGEIWVEIPRENALALGALNPNPTAGADLVVPYVLASRDRARLEILDIAGRLLGVREIDDPSPGPWRWTPRLKLAAGIYHVRLLQGGHSSTRRIAVTW